MRRAQGRHRLGAGPRWLAFAVTAVAASVLAGTSAAAAPHPRHPKPQPAPSVTAASPPPQSGTADTSQQCGLLDPTCTILSAIVAGPIAAMGAFDGSPDPAAIDPVTGAVTNGPWHLITTTVGVNPVVDNYDGSLGGPAHECGSAGCIPWVQTLDHIAVPISLALLVLVLLVQLIWFMAGQQMQLRRHVLPSLVAAAALAANLPLHAAGRIIDAGSWLSQTLVSASLTTPRASPTASAIPRNMMTVLAMTAYCPADSPVAHPGIHISWPGSTPSEAVLVKPWMDRTNTQSHCLAASDPDFVKEVTDRSDNVFGPPLHDINCDATVVQPDQPLCTNTDNTVNQNHNQDCLEGSGSADGVVGQLNALPLPGEPIAGNGQRPADCRYADIYWGTTPTFTNVWAGVGPHGRNGYDVPDGLLGMVAYTVLTVLGLVLALGYVVRYIVLSLLTAFSAFAVLALVIPGGGDLFARWLRLLIGLSMVVVVQTAVFIVFVAVVSTVSGLAPATNAAGCPVFATASAACSATAGGGWLAAVGSAAEGDQIAKCSLAVLTVYLMLMLPGWLFRHDMHVVRGTRLLVGAGLAAVTASVALAGGRAPGAALAAGRRVAGAPMAAAAPARAPGPQAAPGSAPGPRPTGAAAGARIGTGRPADPGRLEPDGWTLFVGHRLADRPLGDPATADELGLDPDELARRQRSARPRGRQGTRARRRLGAAYIAADGRGLPAMSLAFVRSQGTPGVVRPHQPHPGGPSQRGAGPPPARAAEGRRRGGPGSPADHP